MKKSIRYLISLVGGVVVSMVLQWPGKDLRMIACDVGQGDAILLTQGFSQVLVDGGPSGQKVLACLRRHIPFWDRRIELIVMTHSDKDHMNGLSDVLKRYELIYFATGDGIGATDGFDRLIETIRDEGVDVLGVEQGDELRVGGSEGISARVLWPSDINREKLAVFHDNFTSYQGSQILGLSARGEDVNERSVVLEVEWEGYKILLTGDSGDQTEKSLIEAGMLQNVDVVKVGHHGSKFSSSQEFLEMLNPEVAVVSVGKNSYGHPTSETLGRLKNVGAEIRRTDEEGDVVIIFRAQ